MEKIALQEDGILGASEVTPVETEPPPISDSGLSSKETLESVALEGIRDEAKDRIIYERLADSYKGSNQRYSETFRKLAATECKHYNFWRKIARGKESHPSRFEIWAVLLLRRVFGTTFAIKFLESHETETIERYKSVAHLIPDEDKKIFQEIINDEVEHEKGFRADIESSYVKYISFVILGLADAIVEISGIHAGSLGIYNSTRITGLAGVVAGAAASIAMASAAFAQAKQGFKGSASLSAIFTGISYFISAVILAGPYFLTENKIDAMATSLILGVVILLITIYYNSVISEGHFRRDFAELVAIMLAATVVLYVFGEAVRIYTGITI